MCEVSKEIEAKPRLMALLVEIRQTIKRLVHEIHPPRQEEAHGAPSNVRHA
jgi:hypothetical protein